MTSVLMFMGGKVTPSNYPYTGGSTDKWILVRAACVRCHRTKCLLLTAFFLFLSASLNFSPRSGYPENLLAWLM
jgi:hypothetical protein